MTERVVATEAAQALIASLQAEHGRIFFHQSGGCCDNSAANCYLPGDLTIGAQDVLLGHVGAQGDVPFYISKSQYGTWKHTQVILDVIDGTGGTFSLEGSTGKAFHTRSRLFTEAEWGEIGPLAERDLA